MKKQIIAIVLALVLVMCLGVTAAFANDGDSPVTYSVTVTVNNDEYGTAAADPAEGTTDTEVTLTANPAAGYAFKEWNVKTGGVTVKDNKFTIGEANVVIEAVFEEEAAPAATYTVTAAEATNGMVRVDKPEAAEGDKVKITAEANDGYVIDEITYSYTTAEATEPTVETVSKDKKNSFTGNITMPAADVTVAATFREGYPITTRVDKAGTGTVEVEPQSGIKDDKITVKVKPADGYELEKVVYIVSGNSKENKITIKSNKGTFDMPDNKAVTVKAYFTAIDYTVTVDDAIENGKATVSKKTANVGDTITVKATPDYGYAVAKITYKEDGSTKKIDI
ncbi:MAG: hypothetical protein IIZ45_00185, partial [Firmicutes bacterium]|nr:hypothetical protein [Bacillota bacterium]